MPPIEPNTTPLPTRDAAETPELGDDELSGKWESVFTNRDALHAAISDDDGKTWRGFREIALCDIRNAGDFRELGNDPAQELDKSVHQTQALELSGGKVLLVYGQNRAARRHDTGVPHRRRRIPADALRPLDEPVRRNRGGAKFLFRPIVRGDMPDGGWHTLSAEWDEETGGVELVIDGRHFASDSLATCPPFGLSYLHLQTLAEDADSEETYIRRLMQRQLQL